MSLSSALESLKLSADSKIRRFDLTRTNNWQTEMRLTEYVMIRIDNHFVLDTPLQPPFRREPCLRRNLGQRAHVS